jgi:two-component system OmpR family sensor kinase
MKNRLVWKIWGTFWVALILVACVPFAVLMVRGSEERDWQRRTERLHAAAAIYSYAGQPALNRVTATWPEADKTELDAVLKSKVVAGLPPLPSPNPSRLYLILAQLAVGLVASAALAFYLVRPLKVFRTGFHRVSQGELDTRLSQMMGGRKDEISDLAREFDLMAARLEQLVVDRDRLLHDVSHELRSPLARLNVAIELAKLRGNLPAKEHARIESECSRLNSIIGDLLSLSRAESLAAVEASFFDLADLLRAVCEDARYEALPRNVTVSLEISDDLADQHSAPLVHGPPELLRRAIENVIRNALRFSSRGKVVSVCAHSADGKLIILVRDHGPGVDEAMIEHIFTPFVRGPKSGGGAGLGLSIAKRALETFGGSISAFNHETGGLVTSIYLPISRV